jgi:hypothetical protein
MAAATYLGHHHWLLTGTVDSFGLSVMVKLAIALRTSSMSVTEIFRQLCLRKFSCSARAHLSLVFLRLPTPKGMTRSRHEKLA